MADLPQDPTQELKAVLSEHLSWHGARIGFLTHFLLALLKVRSVNLAELATGFGGKAKVEGRGHGAYADRWQVETLFAALKSRGFNLEDTHLTDSSGWPSSWACWPRLSPELAAPIS